MAADSLMITCFACGARLREDRAFLAHVAGEDQNVYVGKECSNKMTIGNFPLRPWQPPKGGPPLLPGWKEH